MALPNNNPTKTIAWQQLTDHFNEIKDVKIQDLYKDEARKNDFLYV